MKPKLKNLVLAALMAALICIATMLLKVPSPLKGYLNLGDGFVLVAGWILSPVYGALAAGLGSALADVFAGYVTYAPVTFLIKGLMALIAFYGVKLLRKPVKLLPAQLIGAVTAELVMVGGYYVFEGFLYGFGPSLINVPANGVQGIAGIILGIILIKVLEKVNSR